MLTKLLWALGILVGLALLDRLLLHWERKGWINYRRRGLSRSGAAFHALTLHSIFNPSAAHLQQVEYQQIEEQDDSGEPPPDEEDGAEPTPLT